MAIIDISQSISNGMAVWPGDPPVVIMPWPKGVSAPPYVSRITMGTHSGTHVDAPAHLVHGAVGVDQLLLDALVGPATVIRHRGPGPLRAADLDRAPVSGRTERLLIATCGGDWPWAGIDAEAAELLVIRGIRLIGVDSESVDALDSEVLGAHHILLGAGVVIVEGLSLNLVEPGHYTLVCLPLKLQDADGAPTRAVLLTQ